jgi:hypothetical protein
MIDVLLISKPAYDLPTFLALANEMLGYSPARAADTAGLSGLPHLMACLAGFRNKDSKNYQDIYNLLYFVFIIAADEQNMLLIMEILDGMGFALSETRIRGVQALIVGGTLKQWKSAVLRGCRKDQDEEIRACFDKVYLQFQAIGLADVFGKKHPQGQTFYLEDLR